MASNCSIPTPTIPARDAETVFGRACGRRYGLTVIASQTASVSAGLRGLLVGLRRRLCDLDRRRCDPSIGRHPRGIPLLKGHAAGGAFKAVDLARSRHRFGAMVEGATSALPLFFGHRRSLRRHAGSNNTTLVALARVNLHEHSFKQLSRSLCRTPERHARRPVSLHSFTGVQ
jgi:hypothetical protein